MNNKDQYWARLKRKNPALQNESTKMTMPVSAFRRQLERAHDAGFHDGMDTAKSLQNLGGSDEPLAGGFADMINKMGKGGKE